METWVLIRKGIEGQIEVVRTYSSERRAKEDLELLNHQAPFEYSIQCVEHIDS